MPTREDLQNGFYIGDFEVLPARRVIRRGDEETSPEPKVFDVLMSLAMRDGAVVSRDELIDEVWDGRATADGPINRAATQLRGHFNDKHTPYRYIAAKHRVGYCLQQPVRLKVEPQQPVADAGDSTVPTQGLWFAVAVVAVVAAVIIGAIGGRMSVPVPTDGIEAIGIQPFEVASDAPEDDYIATGLKAELISALVQVSDITIKNGSVDYPGTPVATIAKRLGVDVVVTAMIVRIGQDLKLAWKAERGVDGKVLKSDSVTGSVDDILGLQQKFIASVRGNLFPGTEQRLITGGRATGAGTESYYLGLYAMERRGEPGNLSNAIEHLQTAIRLDPDFGPAYLSLATAYALLPDLAGAPVEEAHRLAIRTVQTGIDVDDSITDAAGAIHGFVYHKQKRWQEAEQAYVRAVNAPVVDSNAFNWYSRMLASVGRLDAALEQAIKAQQIDPDSGIINSRLAIAYTWLGDRENAGKFFERSRELQVGGATHLLANALFLYREGDLDAAKALTLMGARQLGTSDGWIEPVFTALADPSEAERALDATSVAVANEQMSPQVEIIVRTLLGDTDGAIDIARQLEAPGEVFEMDLLFIPEMQPLREHPDFETLLEALNIRGYWESSGCTYADYQVSCPPA
ncbi:MAG: winged helix-turn-helix domain-containing protein [Woeseiaceae bacterium]|nr:winged helix-turn-helix domain-containing protein [Woeseiaceae bacterium]